MQDHRAIRPAHFHLREDHRLGGSQVPVVGRRFLEVPVHPAALAVDRDERIEIEIVASAGRTHCLRIGTAIARADNHLVEQRVIGDRIPHRSAAADIPAGLLRPSLERGVQFRMFLRAAGGIARYRPETPFPVPAAHVVSGDVTARVIFGAGIADDDHVAGDLGCAGYGIGAVAVGDRIHAPHHGAADLVERVENAVQRGDEDLAIVDGNPAIGLVAAGRAIDLHVELGREGPQLLAGRGIERIDAPEIARRVHHSVDHDRGGFLHAVGAEVIFPGKTQFPDIGGSDFAQPREMAAGPVAAGIVPILGRADSQNIDLRRLTARRAGGQRQQERRRDPAQPVPLPLAGGSRDGRARDGRPAPLPAPPASGRGEDRRPHCGHRC